MKAQFIFTGVQPPSNTYVPPGQALLFTFFNMAGTELIFIVIRILRADGEIREITRTLVVLTTLTGQTVIIPLTECYILSVSVRADDIDLHPGQFFGRIDLIGGTDINAPLIQQLECGYVSGQTALSFPESRHRLSIDCVPLVKRVTPANPAAGANLIWTAPVNQITRLLQVNWSFVASVAVANRYPMLSINKGGFISFRKIDTTVVVGSGAQVYYYCAGSSDNYNSWVAMRGLQPDFILNTADQLIISAINMDAGDTITNISITYESRFLI
jgi:hypothetical protein